jgi:hypothetical protein
LHKSEAPKKYNEFEANEDNAEYVYTEHENCGKITKERAYYTFGNW